jgi:hypothetical protein
VLVKELILVIVTVLVVSDKMYPTTKQKRPIAFISGDSALWYILSVMKILPIKDTLFLSVP